MRRSLVLLCLCVFVIPAFVHSGGAEEGDCYDESGEPVACPEGHEDPCAGAEDPDACYASYGDPCADDPQACEDPCAGAEDPDACYASYGDPCADDPQACEGHDGATCYDASGDEVSCEDAGCFDEAGNEVSCEDAAYGATCYDANGDEVSCEDAGCFDGSGNEVSCGDAVCFDESGNEVPCEEDGCLDEAGNEVSCEPRCFDERGEEVDCGDFHCDEAEGNESACGAAWCTEDDAADGCAMAGPCHDEKGNEIACPDPACYEALEPVFARLDAHHQSFMARWDAHFQRWNAFWETEPSEEEVEAFEAEMRAAEEDLLAEEERALGSIAADLEASGCADAIGFDPLMMAEGPVIEVDAVHEACTADVDAAFVAFEAEQRAIMEEWEETDGEDHDTLDTRLQTHAEAFQKEVSAIIEACNADAEEAWQETMGETLMEAPPVDKIGSWELAADKARLALRGKFVSLFDDPSKNQLSDFKIKGRLYFESIRTDGGFPRFEMPDHGEELSYLEAQGTRGSIRLHDAASGLITLQAAPDAVFRLVLPANLAVQAADGGFTISGTDGAPAFLRADGDAVVWDAGSRTLSVSGDAVFLVPSEAKNQVLQDVANRHRDEIMAALNEKRVAAEVTMAGHDDGAKSEVLVFDQVDCNVQREGDGVSLTVGSETLEDGRTIVMNLDAALVNSTDLAITYYDLQEDGTKVAREIRPAESIEDVLDATDDDSAEYWVVSDDDGKQVMVSVDHWSVHVVHIAPATAGSDDDSIRAPAVPVGLIVLGLASLAGWVRRD